ncbi:Chaperone protein DnaJ [Diplonema papillatum]|nr:Chaperone protein DnaJ [Diplonema papillatum]KAJ9445618.1 Chaperone protein DnaJ [Diplonema papillatum]|eukprot:gene18362-28309_t
MLEWDRYLAAGPKKETASSGLEALLGGDLAGDGGRPHSTASGSPIAAGAGGGVNDPFSMIDDFAPAANAQTDAPSKQPGPKTADDLLRGFVESGTGGRSKTGTQSLAALNQKDHDTNFFFGDDNAPRKKATAPSKMMQALMNYYEVLGVAETAAPDEIRQQYKAKSLKFHPDRNPNLHEDDEHMFKLITKAYETLSDPTMKAQYDIEVQANRGQRQPAAQGNWLFHLNPGAGGGGAPQAQQGGGGGGGGFGAASPMNAGMGGFGMNPGMGQGMSQSPMGGAGFGVPSPQARAASPPSQPKSRPKNTDPFSDLF